MLIKKLSGVFIKSEIASGQSISAGNVVALSNGKAVLADKDNSAEAIGLAKEIDGDTIYIQTQGKYPHTDSSTEYWLGSTGSIVSTPPTSGMVQKIAHRIDDQNILIHVDKTVIIL